MGDADEPSEATPAPVTDASTADTIAPTEAEGEGEAEIEPTPAPTTAGTPAPTEAEAQTEPAEEPAGEGEEEEGEEDLIEVEDDAGDCDPIPVSFVHVAHSAKDWAITSCCRELSLLNVRQRLENTPNSESCEACRRSAISRASTCIVYRRVSASCSNS